MAPLRPSGKRLEHHLTILRSHQHRPTLPHMLQACSWQLAPYTVLSNSAIRLQSEMQLLAFGQCNLFASEERTMSGEAERPTSSDDGDRNSTIRSSSPQDPRPLSRWWLAISRRAGFFAVGLAAFCVVVEFRAHSGLLGVRGPDAYWALHLESGLLQRFHKARFSRRSAACPRRRHHRLSHHHLPGLVHLARAGASPDRGGLSLVAQPQQARSVPASSGAHDVSRNRSA